MATGTYTDGSNQDLTSVATWSSSDATVATISNTVGNYGLATSSGQGTATISAASNSVSNSTTLTVGQASLSSIVVAPVSISIALGYSEQFSATAMFTDGSTQDITQSATWTSSVPAIGAMSSPGYVTSVSPGNTTITASSGSVTASSALLVIPPMPISLAVSPSTSSVLVGAQQQFTATLTYSNGTSANVTSTVMWSSLNPAVATVTSGGLAVGVATGSSAIEANWGSTTLVATSTLSVLSATGPFTVPLNPTCTIYVSPSGNASLPGSSFGSPTTVAHAIGIESAGSVVCFEAGTYSDSSGYAPRASGTASAPIIWVDYNWLTGGETHAAIGSTITWTGGCGSTCSTGTSRFMISFTAPYRAFLGLSLNGNNYANGGIVCLPGSGHHYEYYGNQVTGVIYSGLSSSSCGDYNTILNNWIWLNGENPNGVVTVASNAGSGITVNQATALAGDTYTGLHNVFANNIVAGQFDSTSGHTDGNGISLDLVKTQTLGGSLVANNVVYGNGGNGIEVDSPGTHWTNVIVVNNTCYKNSLDLTSRLVRANYDANAAQNTYWINNISYAWQGWGGTVPNWYDINGSTGTTWTDDMWFGGVKGVTATITYADPLLANPPYYDPSAGGQYASSLSPAALGNDLMLLNNSPAVAAGVDPTTVTGISGTQIATDIAAWVYTDINGNSRTPGSAFTLGAYTTTQ